MLLDMTNYKMMGNI